MNRAGRLVNANSGSHTALAVALDRLSRELSAPHTLAKHGYHHSANNSKYSKGFPALCSEPGQWAGCSGMQTVQGVL